MFSIPFVEKNWEEKGDVVDLSCTEYVSSRIFNKYLFCLLLRIRYHTIHTQSKDNDDIVQRRLNHRILLCLRNRISRRPVFRFCLPTVPTRRRFRDPLLGKGTKKIEDLQPTKGTVYRGVVKRETKTTGSRTRLGLWGRRENTLGNTDGTRVVYYVLLGEESSRNYISVDVSGTTVHSIVQVSKDPNRTPVEPPPVIDGWCYIIVKWR